MDGFGNVWKVSNFYEYYGFYILWFGVLLKEDEESIGCKDVIPYQDPTFSTHFGPL